MPVIDLVTDALACYRITRLVTEDVILDKPRDALLAWATKGACTATLDGERCERPGGHSGQHRHDEGDVHTNWPDDIEGAEPPDPALRVHPKVAEFIGCPHCVGMWCAFGVVIARRFFPRQWTPIARALALSGFTSIVAEKS